MLSTLHVLEEEQRFSSPTIKDIHKYPDIINLETNKTLDIVNLEN